MTETITREDFEGHLNTMFNASFTPGTWTPLELIEVTERFMRRDYEQFSLLFLGPVDAPLVQEDLTVAHPVLGTLELSLVPVARDQGGTQYQSVFNRKQPEPTE
jgi:hypothetical protein